MSYHNINSSRNNNNDKNGSRHRYNSFLVFISSMTTAVVLLVSILSNASKVGAIARGTTSSSFSSSRGQPQKIRTTQPQRRVRGSSSNIGFVNQRRRTTAGKMNSIPAAAGLDYRFGGEASGMLPDDLWFLTTANDNDNDNNENYNDQHQNQNQPLNLKHYQKSPKEDKTTGFFGKENKVDETATTAAAAGEDGASNGAGNDSSSNSNNNNNELETSNDSNSDNIAEEDVVVDPSSTSSTTTTSDLVCTAVESQKQNQQSLSEVENEVATTTTTTSTTVFLVDVSVVYHTDKVTETMIETYLDVVNIPVALWISGCKEKAKMKLGYQQQQQQQVQQLIDADPSVRRRKRNLQVQMEEGGITANTIGVAYSEVESWENNGTLTDKY